MFYLRLSVYLFLSFSPGMSSQLQFRITLSQIVTFIHVSVYLFLYLSLSFLPGMSSQLQGHRCRRLRHRSMYLSVCLSICLSHLECLLSFRVIVIVDCDIDPLVCLSVCFSVCLCLSLTWNVFSSSESSLSQIVTLIHWSVCLFVCFCFCLSHLECLFIFRVIVVVDCHIDPFVVFFWAKRESSQFSLTDVIKE